MKERQEESASTPVLPKPKIYQDKGAWWVEKAAPGWLDILGPFPSKEEALRAI